MPRPEAGGPRRHPALPRGWLLHQAAGRTGLPLDPSIAAAALSSARARTARVASVALMTIAAGAAGATATSGSAETPHRHRAAITLTAPAALVQLPLTPQAYAHSQRPGLADLRIVDARGERVPFAFLAPPGEHSVSVDTTHPATLYRLPPRPAQGEWASPVTLSVDPAGRITVQQRGGTGAGASPPPASATPPPGYLIDLGPEGIEPPPGEARGATLRRHSLRLHWQGEAEFSIGYTLEHSPDLKGWRAAPGGQVSALALQGAAPGSVASAGSAGSASSAAPAGGSRTALTQRDVALPADTGRFVRLVWAGDGAAPVLRQVERVQHTSRSASQLPLHTLAVPPVAAPGTPDADSPRALHFDLGAPLPLRRISLELPAGTRVLPVQVQLRTRADEAWRTALGTVFYRLDRSDGTAQPPPLALQANARWLRLLVDPRAALPPSEGLRLRAEVELASLVFSQQGQPPFELRAGSPDAAPGALPLATLVPDLAAERPRLGQASLGPWHENPQAAAQAERRQRLAAARPWLLWSLLGLGVLGLGWMVWRLAPGRSAADTPSRGGHGA